MKNDIIVFAISMTIKTIKSLIVINRVTDYVHVV